MRYLLFSLPFGFFSLFAFAEVKPFMTQMLQEMFHLKPFIASEEKYLDPKNSAEIEASLKKMVGLSKKINHEEKIQKTGFRIPSKVLDQQLTETEVVFRNGNKAYSLWLLKSTLGVCMSCHTQLPSVSAKFAEMDSKNVLANPFEEAEFQFVIRDFEDAMKQYEVTFAGFPKNKVTDANLEKIIYRQMFYYVRVKRDFAGLSKALSTDLANSQIPDHLKKKIKKLKVATDSMKGEKFPQFNEAQETELRSYVESTLKDELSGKFSLGDPKKELRYLKVSSVLYEYMNQFPGTSLKPDILYWLSFCESHYSYKAFYSFPELYLKQCVLDFPKSPVAKKCLTEYQDLVTREFSGIRGTEIPAEVSAEIKSMQDLVKSVGN